MLTRAKLVSLRARLCSHPSLLPSTLRPATRKTKVVTQAICQTLAKGCNNLRVPIVCSSGVMLRQRGPLQVTKATGTKRGIAIDVTKRGNRTVAASSKG